MSVNAKVSFQGSKKVGDFEIAGATARTLITEPINVNGRPNSDVISRSWLSTDFMSRDRDEWIIDFGTTISEPDATKYEGPFKVIEGTVKNKRILNARKSRNSRWWIHGDAQPAMRTAISQLRRYIVTPEVHNLRLFFWADSTILPDCKIIVIASSEDFVFGILCSKFHVEWAKYNGGVRGDGRTYTPSTAFETFPFPDGMTPDSAQVDDPRVERIAAAARTLDELRRAWLNPPDLVDILPEVTPTAAQGEAPRRYPDRIVAKTAEAAVKLKERTLTNLYSRQRPQWLVDAHLDLDAAVAAAYGWPAEISEEDALANLLALNLDREPPPPTPTAPDQPPQQSDAGRVPLSQRSKCSRGQSTASCPRGRVRRSPSTRTAPDRRADIPSPRLAAQLQQLSDRRAGTLPRPRSVPRQRRRLGSAETYGPARDRVLRRPGMTCRARRWRSAQRPQRPPARNPA